MRNRSSSRVGFILLPALIFLGAASILPHRKKQPPATTRSTAVIEVGDTLTVTVDDLVGLDVVTVTKPTVDANGGIKLPLTDDKVKVDGLTPSEAAKKIAKAYSAKKIVTNAQVRVSWVRHAVQH